MKSDKEMRACVYLHLHEELRNMHVKIHRRKKQYVLKRKIMTKSRTRRSDTLNQACLATSGVASLPTRESINSGNLERTVKSGLSSYVPTPIK